MIRVFDKLHRFMNEVKGFTVGYSITDKKMLFDFDGKRYVAEFREIDNPSDDMVDGMRRIKYL